MQEEHVERASGGGTATDLRGLILRNMVRARVISARMVSLQRAGRIAFHTSSIGEEAAIVGAVLATRDEDYVFPGAREWYAALARGLDLGAYVHHAFGSANDPAKGHSAPDHPPARAHRVVPPSGVVGAHLPQAVGLAWAARIAKEKAAVVALFGPKAADSGDFHNALNFAGVFKAPVVFVCRGNIGDRAVAYGLASARVDGGDALAVHAVVRAALQRAHEGKGATLIEAPPPALLLENLGDDALASGNVLDLGEADPIVRLAGGESLDPREFRAELDLAITDAEQAGPPQRETIFEDVYATVPRHLEEQRAS
jgi:TPP-dependent pyruvate/acetoin dehydrogenase alpha subunit